jgi:uncharacterized membrane protein
VSVRTNLLQPAVRRRGRLIERGSDGARLSEPSSATEVRVVIGLTVLAAVLRFYGLGHQGFWFDEANTALLVKFSPGTMLGLIPQTESTPPLYYMVAWVWSRVFGDHEAGLRSLSAVCGVLTVPVAWAAARALVSRRAALIVCALTACNPLLIWYSQEARSYELLVLLTAVTLLAFAYAREAPSALTVGAWALASALALATHYYAVVTVAPQAAWLLWERRDRAAVRIGVGIVAVCGLALVPLALSQNSTGNDSWIVRSPLNLRLAQIVPQFLIGTGSPWREPLKFVAFLLVLIAVGLLAVRATRAERDGALIAGVLALAGFALSLLFVAAGSDALITRNVIGLWLPATIFVAGGLATVEARKLGLAITVALCAIGLVAAIGVQSDRDLQRPDWRPVSAALGAPAATRLLLVQHYRTLLPLSLYQHRLGFLRAPAANGVREIDVISISSPQQPLCWWGAACNLMPSQMQRRYLIRGFREVSLRHVEQFTIMRLLSARPRTVSRREVARALVTTSLRRDGLLIQRS